MPSLATSNTVLGLRKAKHLLRRACFHYNRSTLEYFASLTPTQAVDELSLNETLPWQDPYDTVTNPQDGLNDGFGFTVVILLPLTPMVKPEKRNNFRLVVV